MTEDIISPIGSVTKAFTAVVIMQLVDEGHLSLNFSASTVMFGSSNDENALDHEHGVPPVTDSLAFL